MRLKRATLSNTLIIGDVHSDDQKLFALLEEAGQYDYSHIVFLGDLVDRGPNPHLVVQMVKDLVDKGIATVIMGNHDWKFFRLFRGNKKVQLKEEQEYTLSKLGVSDKLVFNELFGETVGVFDPENKIMLGHAAAGRPQAILEKAAERLTEELKILITVDDLYQTESVEISKKIATKFMYGIICGSKLDENGYPLRLRITKESDDNLDGWKFIHGHTHAKELFPERQNPNVVCLDWGCGEPEGKLAGLFIDENGKVNTSNLLIV